MVGHLISASSNDKPNKTKMKKNANEHVDYENEKKKDPKYKTELCKSYSQTNFCVYGNKCRFAHGSNELSEKPVVLNKYKQKECNSFHTQYYCSYGKRCHFKHGEITIREIKRLSYYFYLLNNFALHLKNNRNLSAFFDSNSIKETLFQGRLYNPVLKIRNDLDQIHFKGNKQRLKVFQDLPDATPNPQITTPDFQKVVHLKFDSLKTTGEISKTSTISKSPDSNYSIKSKSKISSKNLLEIFCTYKSSTEDLFINTNLDIFHI